MLVPGQVVDAAILGYLVRLLQTQKSIELNGLAIHDGELHLRVLTPAELVALRPLA